MRKGILERIYDDFEDRVFSPEDKKLVGIVKLEYVVDFVKDLQKHLFDGHILIMGQNGSGKSMLMLALMKLLAPESITNGQLLYAFNRTGDFIKSLSELKNTTLGVDEINVFFNYRQSMATTQVGLFNMIEIAREHRVAIISCTRDARRVNNNYRDGKVQIVIWVLDRYEPGHGPRTYCLVFLGNPVLEEQDKFRLNSFQNLYSFEEIRRTAEALPTFYGYLFFDDVKKYISDAELEEYKKKKEQGIKQVYQNWADRIEGKENLKKPIRQIVPDKMILPPPPSETDSELYAKWRKEKEKVKAHNAKRQAIIEENTLAEREYNEKLKLRNRRTANGNEESNGELPEYSEGEGEYDPE